MEEMSREVRIIRLMKQIFHSVKKNLGNEFRPINLTGPQGMLMGTLGHKGKMKISELSHELGLSNSTVSGMIDRLEKQGMVERIRSSDDRRVVYVDATPEFKKCSKEHFKKMEQKIAAMMNRATQEELDKVLEAFEILKRIMDDSNE